MLSKDSPTSLTIRAQANQISGMLEQELNSIEHNRTRMNYIIFLTALDLAQRKMQQQHENLNPSRNMEQKIFYKR